MLKFLFYTGIVCILANIKSNVYESSKLQEGVRGGLGTE
jgi:hypothetical protein